MTLPGLLDFTELFSTWLQALSEVWNVLNFPIGELLAKVPFLDTVAMVINPLFWVLVHNTPVESVTLLAIIIGNGLWFYLVYQFIVWLLNIIT